MSGGSRRRPAWTAIFSISILGLTSQLAIAEPFTYRVNTDASISLRLFPPDRHSANGYVMYGNHIEAEAKYCSPTSEFYCVISLIYSFAVPKRLGEYQNTNWSVHGIQFSLIASNRSLSLFGLKFDDIWVIATPAEGTLGQRTIHSYYSLEHGLIGFEDPGDQLQMHFWLSGKQGFGSALH